MATQDLFRQAVTAAKIGERKKARKLLLELVQTEPRHELAWLWLSAVMDDLDDKIIALENAHTINPKREQTIRKLNQLRGQPESPNRDNRFQRAVRAYKNGRHDEAREILWQLVETEPKHEKAWLGLGKIAARAEDRIIALENVLEINPHNEQAQKRLSKLQLVHDNHFTLGRAYEEKGYLEKAVSAYKKAEARAISPANQIQVRQRRMQLEKELKSVRSVKATNPVTDLVRLTAGPVIMYGLLLLIYSGLNPLQMSPLLLISTLGVIIGGLITASIRHASYHTFWEKLFGPDSLDNALTRNLIILVAIMLMFIPYLILFMGAFDRLEIYRASFTPMVE